MKYIVELDMKFEVINDNKTKVSPKTHGLIKTSEHDYRSRYPYVATWFIPAFDEFEAARYAIIEFTEEMLHAQLNGLRRGFAYCVFETYQSLSEEEVSLIHAKPIKLSDLLKKTPVVKKVEVRWGHKIAIKISEEDYQYLELIGNGNSSAAVRKLIKWARENKFEESTS